MSSAISRQRHRVPLAPVRAQLPGDGPQRGREVKRPVKYLTTRTASGIKLPGYSLESSTPV